MESENMFYLTNEANKIKVKQSRNFVVFKRLFDLFFKLSLMLQGMNLLKYNEKNAENGTLHDKYH